MALLYPKATLDLAPLWKQGYGAYPSPQPKEGFVLHSMVGTYAGARARLMGWDTASWQFSVLRSGEVKQHFRDPRVVAWHAGRVGDNLPLSAAVGNVCLIGIEHEGGAPGNESEPLTPPQLAASIDLQRWLYSVIAELKRPALRASHWEHNWIQATACPSGRIPWQIIIPALEDDMFEQADRDQLEKIERILRWLLGPGDNTIISVPLRTQAKALRKAADVLDATAAEMETAAESEREQAGPWPL